MKKKEKIPSQNEPRNHDTKTKEQKAKTANINQYKGYTFSQTKLKYKSSLTETFRMTKETSERITSTKNKT